MAVSNYGLMVDTSNFQPYSFRDIIDPFLLYKLDYENMQTRIEKYEDEYGNLALPEDSKYAPTLNLYKQDFIDAADSFASGMTIDNANRLRKLFRTAKKDIAPIREATIARNKAVEDFNKMRILDPSLIYDEDAFNIDNYIGGNIPDIKAVSGNAIEADAAATMKAFADLDPAMPLIIGDLKQAFITQKQGGLNNIDAFNEAVKIFKQTNRTTSGNEAVNKFIGMLDGIQNKYTKAGYKDAQLSLIADRVVSGAIKGIPATQYSLMQSPGYTTPYLLALLSLALDQERRQAENDAISRVYQRAQLGSLGWFEDKNGNWYQDLSAIGGLGIGAEEDLNGVIYKKQLKDGKTPTGKPTTEVVWIGNNGKELKDAEFIRLKNEDIEAHLGILKFDLLTSDIINARLNNNQNFISNWRPYYFAGNGTILDLDSDTFNDSDSVKLDGDKFTEKLKRIAQTDPLRVIKIVEDIVSKNGGEISSIPYKKEKVDDYITWLTKNFDLYEDRDIFSKNNWKITLKLPNKLKKNGSGKGEANKNLLIEEILKGPENKFTKEELKGKTLEALLAIIDARKNGF